MALLVAKVSFWVSLEKGFYYLWCLKAVFCWKHYFYSAFSKTQLCRHERMQLEQKQKFTKNRGCLPKCKKGLFLVCFFFAFWWFCFLLPVFWFLCFVKKGPKRLFSCNFRGLLSILFPQKACLKVFLFFLFCFFFAFVFPFKTPFCPFAFWPSAPFWKTLIFLVSFFFFFLLLPFLMFACFFQRNFPNIPFLKSNLLSFLAASFFCCSCFCFGCVCFSLSVFLLLCWLCFWCFFGFVLCFVFVFFLVLVPVYEKSCFPCNSSVFWVLLDNRVVRFYVLCFCPCLFVLCCFFPF